MRRLTRGAAQATCCIPGATRSSLISRYIDNAVYKDNYNNLIADGGSKPNGKSWLGALDMAGNIWQWTSSIYKSYPYKPDDGRERETRRIGVGSCDFPAFGATWLWQRDRHRQFS